jgi:hypothetical protein
MSEERPVHAAPVQSAAASSRRTLLTAGLGALAATVASALGRPQPVQAQDEFMQVGHQYLTATALTQVGNMTSDENVFSARSNGGGDAMTAVSISGLGVNGQSQTKYGIYGYSGANIAIFGTSSNHVGVAGDSANSFGVAGTSAASYGVYGEANGSGAAAIGVHGTSLAGVGMLGKSRAAAQAGVIGWSGANSTGIQGISNGNEANPPAPKAKTGVFGQATQDSSSRGVFGVSTSGHGVRGEATTGGAVVGVANNTAGYAFLGSGRVRFNKVSGIATIAAGTTSKTITPGTDVTTDSFGLLTPMVDIGTRRLWFTKDATANTITIHLSSSSTSSLSIAWLLLS